jgi:SWI/SNF-related matrix-associated actin-dependent regulator 1 of chromatin subfamily A
MPSIFDTIASKAATGAAAGVVAHAQATSTFDGTRTEPSEGFVLPVAPATKTLYSYQLAAVEAILTQRRVLLGLQPGLGKTVIMQAAAAALAAQGQRSIIVVPPSLRLSPWAEEFAQDFPHLRLHLPTGRKAAPIPADTDVVIIGDSIVAARVEDLTAFAPTALFVDEAHRFKNRDAKRTKALTAFADEHLGGLDATIVGATGTLVANHMVDVYSPLRLTGAGNAKAVSGGHSWTRFMDAWCITETIWTGRANVRVATGCRDAEGLRTALTTSCYVSVPRAEVLDLPERTTAVRSLVLNGDAVAYRRMERDFLSWVAETKGDAAYRRAAKAEAITKLMALWEADGLAKIKATTEYVQALTEQGEPVVLFAHHKSVVLALYGALIKEGLRVGTIIGGMSSEEKSEVVTAFQAGDLDVLIGNIEAAGVGLTLTASSHVVFAQLPWAPGIYGQACDRVYRIGQTRHVTTHVLNGNEMVSQTLWAILSSKAATADAINTGTPSTIDPDSVVEEVLASYGW